jgi:hypothetical protein
MSSRFMLLIYKANCGFFYTYEHPHFTLPSQPPPAPPPAALVTKHQFPNAPQTADVIKV